MSDSLSPSKTKEQLEHLTMPQEKHELALQPTERREAQSIEERITQAVDMREAMLFTQIRGELKRQDAEERKQEEIFAAEKRQFWARTGFSLTTILVGTGLVLAGHAMSGFFVIGGALAMFVPNYVKHFVNTVVKGGQSDE